VCRYAIRYLYASPSNRIALIAVKIDFPEPNSPIWPDNRTDATYCYDTLSCGNFQKKDSRSFIRKQSSQTAKQLAVRKLRLSKPTIVTTELHIRCANYETWVECGPRKNFCESSLSKHVGRGVGGGGHRSYSRLSFISIFPHVRLAKALRA
jgi:hypothetical protein